MPERFFAIGVGSNIGDRLGFLCRAHTLIERIPSVSIIATSRIHESAGWGRVGLDPFLNAVIVLYSDLYTASEMLQHLRRIEDQLGRQREVKWGPRTLDLDLLAVNDEVHQTPELTLPHPWIADRPFVYLPFREVERIHPRWATLALASKAGLAIEHETHVTELGAPIWGSLSIWVGVGVGPNPFIAPPSLSREKSAPPSMQSLHTSSEEETLAAGRAIAPYLVPGDTLALNAPLGSGKSVLARGIARGLGIHGPIQSPTYLLCRTYDAGPLILEHWDFYRLESIDDLESTGFPSEDSTNRIRIIEWAERFPQTVVNPTLEITITQTGETERDLQFRALKGPLPRLIRTLCAMSRSRR